MSHPEASILLFTVAVLAGAQNALAGGGSFITLPALMVFGMGARAANITSTIALFPGQVTTGLAGRAQATGAGPLSFLALAGISLVGGGLGALLLLATPESFFERLVPFLVLFATSVFAWGSFFRRADNPAQLSPLAAMGVQTVIAIYGGYFGGGIGMLMLAVLTLSGLPVRQAAATKNLLAGIINCAAVVLFAFSSDVQWWAALTVGVGAIGGGQIGAWMLKRADEHKLQIAVTAVGAFLTLGLFARAYG